MISDRFISPVKMYGWCLFGGFAEGATRIFVLRFKTCYSFSQNTKAGTSGQGESNFLLPIVSIRFQINEKNRLCGYGENIEIQSPG
jgi:hypothetical protein